MTLRVYHVILQGIKSSKARKGLFFKGNGNMKFNTRYPVLFFLCIVLLIESSSWAVSTVKIDQVREKDVLAAEDLEVIDNFVSSAVQELIDTTEFSSVASLRSNVVSRAGSAQSSAEGQYREQFLTSAERSLSAGLEQAKIISEPDRRVKVTVNLLILLDSLENLKLVDAAMRMLGDDNAVVRYWAVHAITSPGVVKQLNTAGGNNSAFVQRIMNSLSALVDKENSPEVIGIAAGFAGEFVTPAAKELLLKIADSRIKKYADWNVDYEILDADILRLLGNKLSQAGNDSETAVRFAQLYSYVIQRYIKGRDILNRTRKRHLISVLVETERGPVSKLLGARQQVIKNAIEKRNFPALTAEHDSLLGSANGVGRLAGVLKFDYGMNGAGAKKTGPAVLSEPLKTGR